MINFDIKLEKLEEPIERPKVHKGDFVVLYDSGEIAFTEHISVSPEGSMFPIQACLDMSKIEPDEYKETAKKIHAFLYVAKWYNKELHVVDMLKTMFIIKEQVEDFLLHMGAEEVRDYDVVGTWELQMNKQTALGFTPEYIKDTCPYGLYCHAIFAMAKRGDFNA